MSNLNVYGFQEHTSEAVPLYGASVIGDFCYGIADGSLKKGKDWKGASPS